MNIGGYFSKLHERAIHVKCAIANNKVVEIDIIFEVILKLNEFFCNFILKRIE